MILKKSFLLFVFACLFCSCDAFGYVTVDSSVKGAWGTFSADESTSGGAGDFILDGGTGMTKKGTCGDEYALVVVIAEQIVEHGGYFCPKQIQCVNKRYKNWSLMHMYAPGGFSIGKCAWLCEDGYTGVNCQKHVAAVPGTDLPMNTSDGGIFSGVSMLQDGCWNGGSVQDASQGIRVFHKWEKYGDEDHVIALGVIDFLEHGVKAAPVLVGCHGEDNKNNRSWISNVGLATGGKTKLLCAEGYMANSTGTDCTRATAQALELKGAVKEVGKSFCLDWDETKYDSSIHAIDLSGSCIKYFCKDSTKAFPGSGDFSCADCTGNIRGGQDKKTGLCVKCEQPGQYFDVDTGTCKMAQAYTTFELQYGKGKTKATAGELEKHCWIYVSPEDYKICVEKGKDFNPTTDLKKAE